MSKAQWLSPQRRSPKRLTAAPINPQPLRGQIGQLASVLTLHGLGSVTTTPITPLNPLSVDAVAPNANAPRPGAPQPHSPTPLTAKRDRQGFWAVFVSTFITIFLAEVGDKTQVTTLLMSAESGKPWVVFLGAGTALVATSLLGVLVGRWLAQRVSPRTLDTAAGAMLLMIAIGLLWDVAVAG